MENENLTEKYINERYYRACATVNLDAIYDNVVNLGKRLKEGTKIIAVVKTDGYGHGAIPIAKTINELVYAYAVATVDEAVNLRRHGIIKPIYVIGYTHESQLKRLIAYDIRASVFTYDMGKAVSEMALAEGKVAKIHIKVDTGMSRIGFKPDDESAAIVKKISELPNLEIEGIFTHFAKADEKDKMATRNQYELFSNFINKLEKLGVQIPVKHCSNSAAMMELPEYNLDACRAGIAMYGLYPSEEVDKSLVDLKPALGLKSHIAYIKTIEKGTEVSYGGTFVADREMKIATIPLGYGDGYRRRLSNKGYVLSNGKKASIHGRICMDQFMVDVTDINASKDDEVVLLGKSGNEEISAERLAEMAGLTFNYEIVCDIGKRIPRVFYRNNKIVGTKDYFDDKYIIEI